MSDSQRKLNASGRHPVPAARSQTAQFPRPAGKSSSPTRTAVREKDAPRASSESGRQTSGLRAGRPLKVASERASIRSVHDTEILRKGVRAAPAAVRSGDSSSGRVDAVELHARRRHAAKISLALKFTLPVGALILGVILLWGLFLRSQTTSTLLNEIKKSGVSRVQLLAQIAQPMVDAHLETMRDKLWEEEKFWPVERFGVSAADFRRWMGPVNNKPTQKNYIEALNQMTLLAHFCAGNSGSKTDVLFAAATHATPGAAEGTSLRVVGSHPAAGAVELRDSRWLKSAGDLTSMVVGGERQNLGDLNISVSDQILDAGGRTYKVLTFSMPTAGAGGHVYLALSAGVIEAEISSLTGSMFGVGLLAVLLACGTCILIATNVTRPVKMLIHDMEVVAAGDFDHRTRAHSTDEIGQIAHEFNEMTRRLAEAREKEKEAMKIENDLELAREVQMHILPTRPPTIKGFEMDAAYAPARQLGGDFYDFFPIDKDRLGIVVADVSGKSIPGAMQMATTRTVLRFVVPGNVSPADTLARTNAIVATDIKRGMFVTAFYAVLDARKKILTCTSAGHNPMVLVHADGSHELINPAGIALGFDKGPIFQRTVKEQALQLATGDRVVLYTDGVVEAMNSKNVEYGDERFFEFCVAHRDRPSAEFIQRLLADLNAHKGAAEQHDDITVVTFRVE